MQRPASINGAGETGSSPSRPTTRLGLPVQQSAIQPAALAARRDETTTMAKQNSAFEKAFPKHQHRREQQEEQVVWPGEGCSRKPLLVPLVAVASASVRLLQTAAAAATPLTGRTKLSLLSLCRQFQSKLQLAESFENNDDLCGCLFAAAATFAELQSMSHVEDVLSTVLDEEDAHFSSSSSESTNNNQK